MDCLKANWVVLCIVLAAVSSPTPKVLVVLLHSVSVGNLDLEDIDPTNTFSSICQHRSECLTSVILLFIA